MQQECDIDVKLVEIWGNCAVWWSVALSTYDLPSVAVPYSSQSCRHLLHIFTYSYAYVYALYVLYSTQSCRHLFHMIQSCFIL